MTNLKEVETAVNIRNNRLLLSNVEVTGRYTIEEML